MMEALSLPQEAIHSFCEQWQIRELALFGSALRPDFNPESDIDLLVSFVEDATPTLLDLVRMAEQLESILGRPVDLLTRRAVEASPNWIRRQSILGSAQAIYARG